MTTPSLKCGVCQLATAKLECNWCQLQLCEENGCDRELHSVASIAAHQRGPIGSAPKPPSIVQKAAPVATTSSTITPQAAPSNGKPAVTTTPVVFTFGPIDKCDICLLCDAGWRCEECKMNLCEVGHCDEELHRAAAIKKHERLGIGVKAGSKRPALVAAPTSAKPAATVPAKPTATPPATKPTTAATPATSKPAVASTTSSTTTTKPAPKPATAPALPKIPPAVVHPCSICHQAEAVIRCDKCQLDLCSVNHCDSELHSVESIKAHVRTPITRKPAPTPTAATAKTTTATTATAVAKPATVAAKPATPTTTLATKPAPVTPSTPTTTTATASSATAKPATTTATAKPTTTDAPSNKPTTTVAIKPPTTPTTTVVVKSSSTTPATSMTTSASGSAVTKVTPTAATTTAALAKPAASNPATKPPTTTTSTTTTPPIAKPAATTTTAAKSDTVAATSASTATSTKPATTVKSDTSATTTTATKPVTASAPMASSTKPSTPTVTATAATVASTTPAKPSATVTTPTASATTLTVSNAQTPPATTATQPSATATPTPATPSSTPKPTATTTTAPKTLTRPAPIVTSLASNVAVSATTPTVPTTPLTATLPPLSPLSPIPDTPMSPLSPNPFKPSAAEAEAKKAEAKRRAAEAVAAKRKQRADSIIQTGAPGAPPPSLLGDGATTSTASQPTTGVAATSDAPLATPVSPVTPAAKLDTPAGVTTPAAKPTPTVKPTPTPATKPTTLTSTTVKPVTADPKTTFTEATTTTKSATSVPTTTNATTVATKPATSGTVPVSTTATSKPSTTPSSTKPVTPGSTTAAATKTPTSTATAKPVTTTKPVTPAQSAATKPATATGATPTVAAISSEATPTNPTASTISNSNIPNVSKIATSTKPALSPLSIPPTSLNATKTPSKSDVKPVSTPATPTMDQSFVITVDSPSKTHFPRNPNEATAAVKIQASFRGHQARKEVELIKKQSINTVTNSSATATNTKAPAASNAKSTAPTVAVATTAAVPPKLCDLCDEHIAAVNCPLCSMDLCLVGGCDKDIHSSAKNSGHIRTPIGGAVVAPPPKPAPAPVASSAVAKPATSNSASVAPPPAATPSSSSEPIPMCDLCDDLVSEFKCPTCSMTLCAGCDKSLHANAKSASHVRTPIKPPSTTAAATPTPNTSDAKPAAAPSTPSHKNRLSASSMKSPSTTNSPTNSSRSVRFAEADANKPAAESSKIPVVPSNSPPAPVCDLCDDHPAVVHCDGCDMNLCTTGGCDKNLHSKPSSSKHIRKPIGGVSKEEAEAALKIQATFRGHSARKSLHLDQKQDTAPSVSILSSKTTAAPVLPDPNKSLCDNCFSSIATLLCVDCGNLRLCQSNCDKELHLPVKKAGHKRVPWPLVSTTTSPMPLVSPPTNQLDDSKLMKRRASFDQPIDLSPDSSTAISPTTLPAMCDLCDEFPATMYCDDCSMYLCSGSSDDSNQCDKNLHKKPTHTGHVRMDIATKQRSMEQSNATLSKIHINVNDATSPVTSGRSTPDHGLASPSQQIVLQRRYSKRAASISLIQSEIVMEEDDDDADEEVAKVQGGSPVLLYCEMCGTEEASVYCAECNLNLCLSTAVENGVRREVGCSVFRHSQPKKQGHKLKKLRALPSFPTTAKPSTTFDPTLNGEWHGSTDTLVAASNVIISRCDLCDEFPAAYHCSDCSMNLCDTTSGANGCERNIHKKPENQHHHRVRLPGIGNSGVSSLNVSRPFTPTLDTLDDSITPSPTKQPTTPVKEQQAATIIQSVYRGHTARRLTAEKKIEVDQAQLEEKKRLAAIEETRRLAEEAQKKKAAEDESRREQEAAKETLRRQESLKKQKQLEEEIRKTQLELEEAKRKAAAQKYEETMLAKPSRRVTNSAEQMAATKKAVEELRAKEAQKAKDAEKAKEGSNKASTPQKEITSAAKPPAHPSPAKSKEPNSPNVKPKLTASSRVPSTTSVEAERNEMLHLAAKEQAERLAAVQQSDITLQFMNNEPDLEFGHREFQLGLASLGLGVNSNQATPLDKVLSPPLPIHSPHADRAVSQPVFIMSPTSSKKYHHQALHPNFPQPSFDADTQDESFQLPDDSVLHSPTNSKRQLKSTPPQQQLLHPTWNTHDPPSPYPSSPATTSPRPSISYAHSLSPSSSEQERLLAQQLFTVSAEANQYQLQHQAEAERRARLEVELEATRLDMARKDQAEKYRIKQLEAERLLAMKLETEKAAHALRLEQERAHAAKLEAELSLLRSQMTSIQTILQSQQNLQAGYIQGLETQMKMMNLNRVLLENHEKDLAKKKVDAATASRYKLSKEQLLQQQREQREIELAQAQANDKRSQRDAKQGRAGRVAQKAAGQPSTEASSTPPYDGIRDEDWSGDEDDDEDERHSQHHHHRHQRPRPPSARPPSARQRPPSATSSTSTHRRPASAHSSKHRREEEKTQSRPDFNLRPSEPNITPGLLHDRKDRLDYEESLLKKLLSMRHTVGPNVKHEEVLPPKPSETISNPMKNGLFVRTHSTKVLRKVFQTHATAANSHHSPTRGPEIFPSSTTVPIGVFVEDDDAPSPRRSSPSPQRSKTPKNGWTPDDPIYERLYSPSPLSPHRIPKQQAWAEMELRAGRVPDLSNYAQVLQGSVAWDPAFEKKKTHPPGDVNHEEAKEELNATQPRPRAPPAGSNSAPNGRRRLKRGNKAAMSQYILNKNNPINRLVSGQSSVKHLAYTPYIRHLAFDIAALRLSKPNHPVVPRPAHKSYLEKLANPDNDPNKAPAEYIDPQGPLSFERSYPSFMTTVNTSTRTAALGRTGRRPKSAAPRGRSSQYDEEAAASTYTEPRQHNSTGESVTSDTARGEFVPIMPPVAPLRPKSAHVRSEPPASSATPPLASSKSSTNVSVRGSMLAASIAKKMVHREKTTLNFNDGFLNDLDLMAAGDFDKAVTPKTTSRPLSANAIRDNPSPTPPSPSPPTKSTSSRPSSRASMVPSPAPSPTPPKTRSPRASTGVTKAASDAARLQKEKLEQAQAARRATETFKAQVAREEREAREAKERKAREAQEARDRKLRDELARAKEERVEREARERAAAEAKAQQEREEKEAKEKRERDEIIAKVKKEREAKEAQDKKEREEREAKEKLEREAKEAKERAEKQAELDRLAKERAEKAAAEAAAEIARLKAEAEARDAKEKQEREEQAAREKAAREAELAKIKAEAEERERKRLEEENKPKHPVPAPKHCDMCEDLAPEVYCGECRLFLCVDDGDGCAPEMHRMAAKKNHQTVPVVNTPAPAPPTNKLAALASPAPTSALSKLMAASKPKLCDNCNENPAGIHCNNCNKDLCTKRCDIELHRSLLRKDHVRLPILGAATPTPTTPAPTPASAPSAPKPSATATAAAATPSTGPKHPCDLCDDGEAVVHCASCDMYLCTANGCDGDMHAGRKAVHVRTKV